MINSSNFLCQKLFNQKRRYFFVFSIILSIIFIFFNFSNVFAGLFDNTPELVKKLQNSFQTIEGWLLNLSTPAAAVAVGFGVFMKKFSFGDEQRMQTAKKLIRGSLFSYGFILAIDLILSAIKSLIS